MTDEIPASAEREFQESGSAVADRSSAPPLRQHFRAGIEAALRTDPVALAASDARTMLGLIIKGLMFEAAYGRVAAIKIMLSLLEAAPGSRADEVPSG